MISSRVKPDDRSLRRATLNDARRLRDLIESDPDDALRPFQTGPGVDAFAPGGLAGAIAYGRAGRVAICVGDPIGPDGCAAFDMFRVAARQAGCSVGVYQASEAWAARLRRLGFRVACIGREASLDLAAFDLEVPGRANLRHTIARARRGGVSVQWHAQGLSESGAATLAEVEGLDRAWMERAGPSLGFTITRFDRHALGHGPVALALDDRCQVVAMATFRRCGAESYVLDLMRRRPGSVPGALEACIAEATVSLRRAGVRTLALGLAPLSGLDRRAEAREERWLAHAAHVARLAYDVDGLTFFKDKFQPDWRPRFLVCEAPSAFPAVVGAVLWLHLAEPGRSAVGTLASSARGVGRASAAQWRAFVRRNQASLRSGVRDRSTVIICATGATWLGSRFGRRGGRRATMLVGVTGAAIVGAVSARTRRAIASGRLQSEPLSYARAMAPSPPGEPPVERPDMTVLIAARNEELVLPDLIRDLAHQDYRNSAGRPRFNVIVIDDRSSDQTLHRTLGAARGAGIAGLVSVRRRRGRDLADGKGAALAFVDLNELHDIVVVLDADARLGPTVLRQTAAHVVAGMPALTLRRSIATNGSWLVSAQATEQRLDAALEQARWALGGAPQFRGNGMVVRREWLRAAGGWRPVLTDDLDLAARVAARTGARVWWPATPEITEQAAPSMATLWRQRERWAEGAIRATIEWTLAELCSSRLGVRARLDRGLYAVQLLFPFVVLGAALGAVSARRMRVAFVLPTVAAAVIALISFDALGSQADLAPLGDRARKSIEVAAFMSIWLAVVPEAALRVAFGRGPLLWQRTPHAGWSTSRAAPGSARSS